jgi:hypothetical protein
MAAHYDDEKISAHDEAQLSEHHRKAGGIAAHMSPERRAQVEKTLKRKLDARCSLFVLIYIMNCKPLYSSSTSIDVSLNIHQISTATTSPQRVSVV